MTSTRPRTFARTVIALAALLFATVGAAQTGTNWTPREVAWVMADFMDGVMTDVCPGERERGVPEPTCFFVTRGTFGAKSLLDDFAYRMIDFTWAGNWDSLGNILGRGAYATNRNGGSDPFYIMVTPHLTDFALVWVLEDK